MANYDVICPIRYPQKCNLSPTEREEHQGPEKYTAFFMYQIKGSDSYLKESVQQHFRSPRAHLIDAAESAGTGVKLCKICRLILTADFGVASLTPFNFNVFMEVGMFWGFGKPALYLFHPNQCKIADLPFDISHEMVIKYESRKELDELLQREVPSFLEKVRLYSEFQYKFREAVKEKLNNLKDKEKDILRWLLLENREVDESTLQRFQGVRPISDEFRNLCDYGFIAQKREQRYDIARPYSVPWFKIHPNYRDILENLLFEARELVDKC